MRGGLGFFGLLLAQHKFNLCSRLKCNGEDAGRGVLAQEKRRRYRPDQKSTPRVLDPSYDVPELFKGTAKLATSDRCAERVITDTDFFVYNVICEVVPPTCHSADKYGDGVRLWQCR